VLYPGAFLRDLAAPMRPFVLLEVGDDNRPTTTRCVHPLVTLLDKLDAISTRFEKGKEAPSFVRHYEDAARIIQAADAGKLPPLAGDPRKLADEMFGAGDIRSVPTASDPAFALAPGERRDDVARSYSAIAPMFWGERIPLDLALETIRDWAARTLG
jgi:hypothetical protein